MPSTSCRNTASAPFGAVIFPCRGCGRRARARVPGCDSCARLAAVALCSPYGRATARGMSGKVKVLIISMQCINCMSVRKVHEQTNTCHRPHVETQHQRLSGLSFSPVPWVGAGPGRGGAWREAAAGAGAGQRWAVANVYAEPRGVRRHSKAVQVSRIHIFSIHYTVYQRGCVRETGDR